MQCATGGAAGSSGSGLPSSQGDATPVLDDARACRRRSAVARPVWLGRRAREPATSRPAQRNRRAGVAFVHLAGWLGAAPPVRRSVGLRHTSRSVLDVGAVVAPAVPAFIGGSADGSCGFPRQDGCVRYGRVPGQAPDMSGQPAWTVRPGRENLEQSWPMRPPPGTVPGHGRRGHGRLGAWSAPVSAFARCRSAASGRHGRSASRPGRCARSSVGRASASRTCSRRSGCCSSGARRPPRRDAAHGGDSVAAERHAGRR